MPKNEQKIKAAFREDVLKDPDRRAAFIALDEMMINLDQSMKENILYPQNVIPSDAPVLIADIMNEEAQEIQMFDIDGKEVME